MPPFHMAASRRRDICVICQEEEASTRKPSLRVKRNTTREKKRKREEAEIKGQRNDKDKETDKQKKKKTSGEREMGRCEEEAEMEEKKEEGGVRHSQRGFASVIAASCHRA